jgi:hypothetical protein
MCKVAVRCLLAASALALYAGSASARTTIVDEARSRYVACYDRVYVPARVLVNTRGKLVRGERHEWEVSPTRWNRVRDAAVYIQTRRTVEPDHYTLVATGCPSG